MKAFGFRGASDNFSMTTWTSCTRPSESCVCVRVCVCVCVFGGENKDKEVERRGGGGERGEYRVGRACSLHPGGHQVSLKAGPRGSQSRQYQFEPYLHAGCKETQCKRVSRSVSNRRR